MSPAPRFGRRHRRDRAARQIAATVLCAIGMVASGGAWWLASPEQTAVADRLTPTMGPAMMLDAPAIAAHSAAQPAAVQPVVETEAAELEAPVAEPVALVPAAPAPAPDVVEPAVASPAPGPMFNGRPIKPVRTVRMLVTAYSPDARSCGKFADNITASGYSVWTNGMKLAAADKKLFPFGTILTVTGYNDGRPIPVLDRGGAIKGNRLDVLYPTHEIALQWGVRHIDVVVWGYAD